MAESLYDILGVAKTATADEIRKKMSAAYEVLSDDKKRAAYDEFGEASLQGGFDPDKAREYTRWQNTRQQRQTRYAEQGPIDFDFGEMFGRQARGPMRGSDMHASVEIDLRQAIEGTELAADLPGHGSVRVRIPKGADTGSLLRVPGKGSPGRNGGPPGDLVIETVLRPHPHLRREGLDLHLALPVTLSEAYNGGTVDVPTFDGPVVLKIPPRSQQGAKLRLRGKGVPRKDERGDLIVSLDVRMPDRPDDTLAEALRAGDAAYEKPVRQEVAL
jgi:curved DNA-binding protein